MRQMTALMELSSICTQTIKVKSYFLFNLIWISILKLIYKSMTAKVHRSNSMASLSHGGQIEKETVN